MMWVEIVFWILLVPMLIFLLVIYFKSRRLYKLFYILSIFTYTMMIMYVIDAYDFGRNLIILLLAFSAVLMMFIGYKFHKLFLEKPRLNYKNRLYFWLAIISMIFIITISFLSSLPIGFKINEETVKTLPFKEVVMIFEEGRPVQKIMQGPVVHTIYFENKFIPRQKVLPLSSACLYNSENGQGSYIGVRWQITEDNSIMRFDMNEQVVQIGLENKKIDLRLEPYTIWRPKPMSAPKESFIFEQPNFDTLFLFLYEKKAFESRHFSCENLQEQDLKYAKKIVIVK